jgi:hypothetical protein
MWMPGKVMRKIGTLPEGAIPNDDEFKIRERANKLLQNWGKIINPSSVHVENGAAAPVAGGDTSMTDADALAEPEPVNGEGARADDKVPDVERLAADAATLAVDAKPTPVQAPQGMS